MNKNNFLDSIKKQGYFSNLSKTSLPLLSIDNTVNQNFRKYKYIKPSSGIYFLFQELQEQYHLKKPNYFNIKKHINKKNKFYMLKEIEEDYRLLGNMCIRCGKKLHFTRLHICHRCNSIITNDTRASKKFKELNSQHTSISKII